MLELSVDDLVRRADLEETIREGDQDPERGV